MVDCASDGDILIFPLLVAMCNLLDGLAVPIPTFPAVSITILCIHAVASQIGPSQFVINAAHKTCAIWNHVKLPRSEFKIREAQLDQPKRVLYIPTYPEAPFTWS